MKINKDLVDATLMLSFIILVLVGTTDFANVVMKHVLMGILAVISIAMVVLRVLYARQAQADGEQMGDEKE